MPTQYSLVKYYDRPHTHHIITSPFRSFRRKLLHSLNSPTPHNQSLHSTEKVDKYPVYHFYKIKTIRTSVRHSLLSFCPKLKTLALHALHNVSQHPRSPEIQFLPPTQEQVHGGQDSHRKSPTLSFRSHGAHRAALPCSAETRAQLGNGAVPGQEKEGHRPYWR